MKRIIMLAAAVIAALPAVFAQTAQEADEPQIAEQPTTSKLMKLSIAADTRFDFSYRDVEGSKHESGFHGRYLNLIIDGSINNKFNFHLRQRLNKFGEMRNDVFGATDWVYLNYTPDEHWTLSGGKQVVAIGGFEYDRAPIDIYYASMFWNNIECYQFGVSASYTLTGGKHTFLGQVCNSPYQPIGNACYAYNLMWVGSMGKVSTIWSTNLIEYARGRYAHFISLGTRYGWQGGYSELDLMNRYSGHQTYFGYDYSIIAKVCQSFGRFDIFAKGGYEHYRPAIGSGETVDKPFYGAGVEFFPLRGSRDLRLHAVVDVTHDSATGTRYTEVAAGLKWRVNLLSR